MMTTPGMNMSTVLGQCPRENDCDRIFKIYMALSVVGSFISACGGTPGYMVLLRSVIIRHSVQASEQRLGILFLNACGLIFQVHSAGPEGPGSGDANADRENSG